MNYDRRKGSHLGNKGEKLGIWWFCGFGFRNLAWVGVTNFSPVKISLNTKHRYWYFDTTHARKYQKSKVVLDNSMFFHWFLYNFRLTHSFVSTCLTEFKQIAITVKQARSAWLSIQRYLPIRSGLSRTGWYYIPFDGKLLRKLSNCFIKSSIVFSMDDLCCSSLRYSVGEVYSRTFESVWEVLKFWYTINNFGAMGRV